MTFARAWSTQRTGNAARPYCLLEASLRRESFPASGGAAFERIPWIEARPKGWTAALAEGFTIVTNDSDLHERSLLSETSPRVIWIRRGNHSTEDIAVLLQANADALLAFGADAGSKVLALY